ncbi:phe13-bombesin receptor-like [Amphiura filiformis]|uniref:phe13-bombesin receptor-like n=1 Tax=Amphiura filiformis TaxID=82378 RepID=UPI003B2279CD
MFFNETEEYIPNVASIASIAILGSIGVVGNLALIGVVLIYRQLRTLPNVLILNLAIGDFFYIICVGPAWIEMEIDPIFLLSEFACKMKHFITLISQGACVFSLTVLSFERYSVIVRGMQTRQSRKKLRTLLAVALVWTLSILLAVPAAVFAQLDMYGCYDTADDLINVVFAMYKALFFYLIPVILISIFYTKVAAALLKSASTLQGQDSHTSNTRQQANRQRLAMICLAITAFFAIFWLPHYAYTMWAQFDLSTVFTEDNGGTQPAAILESFRIIQSFMALVNSAMSPWLLFVLSTTHRRYFLKPCKGCVHKDRLEPHELGSSRSNGISMSNTTGAYRAGVKTSTSVQQTQI